MTTADITMRVRSDGTTVPGTYVSSEFEVKLNSPRITTGAGSTDCLKCQVNEAVDGEYCSNACRVAHNVYRKAVKAQERMLVKDDEK